MSQPAPGWPPPKPGRALSDVLEMEPGTGSLRDRPDVAAVGRNDRVAATGGAFDDRHVDDVVMASLAGEDATRLACSSLIGSTSHIASSRDRLAWRPPPRHASASTGAGTVATTSSARNPACNAHIALSLRSTATSAPVS